MLKLGCCWHRCSGGASSGTKPAAGSSNCARKQGPPCGCSKSTASCDKSKSRKSKPRPIDGQKLPDGRRHLADATGSETILTAANEFDGIGRYGHSECNVLPGFEAGG